MQTIGVILANASSISHLWEDSLTYLAIIGGELLFGTIFLFILCLPFLLSAENRLKTHLSQIALRALITLQDKTVLPGLIWLTWGTSVRVNKDALVAVHSLLPLVTAEDTTLLPSQEERLLSIALQKEPTAIHSAILHALECVGTEVSLQPLQRFVARCKDPNLQARADAALRAVSARAELANMGKVLLRASEMPEQKEELLRPLKESYDPQEAQELLQPEIGRAHV